MGKEAGRVRQGGTGWGKEAEDVDRLGDGSRGGGQDEEGSWEGDRVGKEAERVRYGREGSREGDRVTLANKSS